MSLDKVVHRIKTFFKPVGHDTDMPPYNSIIETDFERDKYKDRVEAHLPGMNSYGTFEGSVEYNQCLQIKQQIEGALCKVRERDLQCEILIPYGLLARVAQDILRMAKNEPCGINGCVLYINLEEHNKCRKLIQVQCDPSNAGTFELYLTFREDTRGPAVVEKFYVLFKSCFWNKIWGKRLPKVLCSGYLLEKKKLYRREE